MSSPPGAPPPDLPVVVVGLMGAGKTSLGAALAARWTRPFSDSDAQIERSSGHSAAQTAQADGPDILHELEAAHLLTALAARPAAVISAAASVVDRRDCRHALRNAFVVWLDLPPDALARRFATGAHRPRYGPDPALFLRAQRDRRSAAFASVADLTIRDDTLPLAQLADAVETRIRQRLRTRGPRMVNAAASRPHVAVTRSTLPGTGLERLASHADVIRWDGTTPPKPADLRALASGMDGLLCLGNDRVDAALLDAAGPRLQVVALASMGFDAVDQRAAVQRGAVVTHTPEVLAETTADLAFALILMTRRRLVAATDHLRAGGWTTFRMEDYLGLDIHGATLGLVGYGQIGRAVARRARGFGMRVLQHDPRATRDDDLSHAVTFQQVLTESDVVSLHVPLTPQTRHLIGAAELAAMKPTATLVNTSRGGVIDEHALLTALGLGQIHSAGLDVFEAEPLRDATSPLLSHPALVVLPHVGSASDATRAAMVDLAVDNILAVLTGRPAPTPLPGTPSLPTPRAALPIPAPSNSPRAATA
jgi:lactate dehydrogenase-like 2-hydroxyacid dehydrogenase/shikimate kinase